MKAKNAVLLCLIATGLLVASPLPAEETDVGGSRDHPLLSRYPGSAIVNYAPSKFDAYVLPLGGQAAEGDSLTESRYLEGKVTRIQYGGIPPARSILEVYRNYETALKKAGFEILFSAKGENELGWHFPALALEDLNPELPEGSRLPSSNPSQRYLAARLARSEGDMYVSLLVTFDSWHEDHPLVQLDIVEIQPMESGLIAVNADALAELPVANPPSSEETDVEESRDHPLLSRYPGSAIVNYAPTKFDAHVLPLGGRATDSDSLTESRYLEGKVTRIQYGGIPPARSILEVYRNYETALKKAGFEILFSAKGENELGAYFPGFALRELNPELPEGSRLGSSSDPSQRYLAAKLARPEGDVYVSLLVTFDSWHEDQNYPLVQLDIIEIQPMEGGLIAVNADALADDIARTGHVAVYGILFDTGKTNLKPESAAVLKEIHRLLEQNPSLNLHVVGHTDNVGSVESNMKLSEDRAAAVVTALVSDHGVAAARLQAHGVGPLTPVAANTDESGRARNRRVELVAQ